MGSSSRRDESYDDVTSPSSSSSSSSSASASDRTAENQEEEERSDGFVVRCLRALDLQVVGACRADERLTPMLKISAGAPIGRGPAEERLIAQLIQHFEVTEIGMLARCLCAPLVSIRVGKIEKRGSMLCPTADRGHLNLNILPSSQFRLSFCSDNTTTTTTNSQTLNPNLPLLPADLTADLSVRQISSDPSHRSFSLHLPSLSSSPSSLSLYFWLSESSLSCGLHLLAKLKDVLERKPTLADLTGICESRLEKFGAHLQAYLQIRESKSGISEPGLPLVSRNPNSSKNRHSSSKNPNLRSRPIVSFKDGSSPKSSSSKTGTREKLRSKRGNEFNFNFNLGPLAIPSLPIVTLPLPLPTIPTASQSGAATSSDDPFALPPDLLPHFSPFNPLTFKFPLPPTETNTEKQASFKPYYCWCPIGSSPVISSPNPLQTLNPPQFSPVPLNPKPLNSSQIPSPLLPSFSSLMSDPIVHIPLMDINIRSSGQLAYLVSTGPIISPAVPLVPVTESLVEKNARETLRRLLESAPRDLSPDPVHGGPFSRPFGIESLGFRVSEMGLGGGPFGIESVMKGINDMGLGFSSEGESESGSEEEENQNEHVD